MLLPVGLLVGPLAHGRTRFLAVADGGFQWLCCCWLRPHHSDRQCSRTQVDGFCSSLPPPTMMPRRQPLQPRLPGALRPCLVAAVDSKSKHQHQRHHHRCQYQQRQTATTATMTLRRRGLKWESAHLKHSMDPQTRTASSSVACTVTPPSQPWGAALTAQLGPKTACATKDGQCQNNTYRPKRSRMRTMLNRCHRLYSSLMFVASAHRSRTLCSLALLVACIYRLCSSLALIVRDGLSHALFTRSASRGFRRILTLPADRTPATFEHTPCSLALLAVDSGEC
jgi:hypothetical protein